MRYKIAAFVLAAVIVAIIGQQLIDFTAFTIGTPPGTVLDPTNIDLVAQTVGDWIWSYRAIDILVQVTILVAAVMGASAMFRARKQEDEE